MIWCVWVSWYFLFFSWRDEFDFWNCFLGAKCRLSCWNGFEMRSAYTQEPNLILKINWEFCQSIALYSLSFVAILFSLPGLLPFCALANRSPVPVSVGMNVHWLCDGTCSVTFPPYHNLHNTASCLDSGDDRGTWYSRTQPIIRHHDSTTGSPHEDLNFVCDMMSVSMETSQCKPGGILWCNHKTPISCVSDLGDWSTARCGSHFKLQYMFAVHLQKGVKCKWDFWTDDNWFPFVFVSKIFISLYGNFQSKILTHNIMKKLTHLDEQWLFKKNNRCLLMQLSQNWLKSHLF